MQSDDIAFLLAGLWLGPSSFQHHFSSGLWCEQTIIFLLEHISLALFRQAIYIFLFPRFIPNLAAFRRILHPFPVLPRLISHNCSPVLWRSGKVALCDKNKEAKATAKLNALCYFPTRQNGNCMCTDHAPTHTAKLCTPPVKSRFDLSRWLLRFITSNNVWHDASWQSTRRHTQLQTHT